jgi:hypothetical protein
MLIQVVPDCLSFGVGTIHVCAISEMLFVRIDQDIQSELVETDNIKQHPPERGRENVSDLAKDRAQALTAPFKRPIIPRDPKCHVSGLGGGIDILEEVDEISCDGV